MYRNHIYIYIVYFFRLLDDGAPDYNHLIPSVHINKIDYVFNPLADGNCGFRAVAHGVKGDEHQFPTIKMEMCDYLLTHEDWLEQCGVYSKDDINRMKRILQHQGQATEEFWFYFPDCCQLAADTFRTPISFHSAEASVFFLPITNNKYAKPKPIILHLQFNHFTRIVYKRGARNITYPPIYLTYEQNCKDCGVASRKHQYEYQS